jgi:hypothetical protein
MPESVSSVARQPLQNQSGKRLSGSPALLLAALSVAGALASDRLAAASDPAQEPPRRKTGRYSSSSRLPARSDRAGRSQDGPNSGKQVLIDTNFVQRHRGGPIVLDQAGALYRLAVDVRMPGTAFVIGAPDVTLDLNRHEVVFGEAQLPRITNGGFEEGSGRSVPGWNLTEAPQAAIAPNTHYLSGKQVLRISNFTTRQRLVSEPIASARPGHTYAAIITPGGHARYETQLRLSVIDTSSGRVLGSGESRNVERGFSAVAHFTPTSPGPVRLQIDCTPAPPQSDRGQENGAHDPDALDLDDAVILPSFDYGILATRTWDGEIKGWSNLPQARLSTYRSAANFTVRNGKLSKGAGDGYGCVPLFCNDLPGLVIDGVETLTRGVDTQSVSAEHASGAVTIRQSRFTEDTWLITNRMDNFSTLLLANIKGPLTVEGNTLIHSPQIGINLGFNDPSHPVKVFRNTIEHRAVTTNAYAIVVAALKNFEIAGNRVNTQNGRGIDVDGFSAEPVTDGLIRDNYVDVRERLNREYPERGESRALRLRNNVDAMGAHRNLRIVNNTFIATTGPGLCQKAFGARISYVNKDGAMNDAGIVIRGNTFRAIASTDDEDYHAEAFVIDTFGAGIRPVIRDNVFESNDVSLVIGESEAGDNADVTFVDNTLRASKIGARPYTGIHFGYWTEQSSQIVMLDMRFKNGEAIPLTWSGSGTKDVAAGHTVTVTVKDETGRRVPHASVRVADDNGRSLYSGQTGDDGTATVPVLVTRYRQNGEDPKQVSADSVSPSTVSATLGTARASVQIEKQTAVTLTLR